MVRGAMLFVDFKRHGMQGVQCVHADTSLKTGTSQLAEPPLHFILHDEVMRALGDVLESTDAFARQW